MKVFGLFAALAGLAISIDAPAQQPATSAGEFAVTALTLPASPLLYDEDRTALREQLADRARLARSTECGADLPAGLAKATALRQCEYANTIALQHREFGVDITPRVIGGVQTEVFTPKDGISPANRNRVLINLHGGGFLEGARTISRLESIPIAGTARITVISVDYRQGPEHRFPAASEDVARVYRELLKTHRPRQIGIYGCSAGGLLTPESVAWIIKEGLPVPGAIAMSCSGGNFWTDGDSGALFGQFLVGGPIATVSSNPYFAGVRPDDPLAFPTLSPATLAKFPPSLLISATRDFGLSSVVNTHRHLVAAGVDADLHVWDGLEHAFHFDPRLRASREVYAVITKFFDKHLGK